MPVNRKNWLAAGGFPPVLALTTLCLLSACMDGGFGGASKSATSPGDPAGLVSSPAMTRKGEVNSPLIDTLSSRRSVLPAGGPFAQVAASVLKAGSGAAESELRVARLTARAKSKNWLPSIGPDVSLSSLGAVAASLLVEQAVFDRGRRKAEREYAAADVEVAAVDLAIDLNKRVYDGLKLYVEAQRAAELAGISEAALQRMAEFDRIMSIRVEGGLSDRSEYRVIEQKKSEMEATLSAERQAVATARAELNAMAEMPLDGVAGLSSLPPDSAVTEPLSVMKSRGDGARMVAGAQMAKAGLMPGLGVSAGLDKDGSVDGGLGLNGDVLGFGRKDSLKALEETDELANRRVAEAQETAERGIVALEREIATLTAQQAQDAIILGQMEANLDLFTEQFKAGRRSLLELAGQFESLTRMKRDHATIKYQIAMAQLEIARERGVLVDGAAM